jgi:hypothetical protein
MRMAAVRSVLTVATWLTIVRVLVVVLGVVVWHGGSGSRVRLLLMVVVSSSALGLVVLLLVVRSRCRGLGGLLSTSLLAAGRVLLRSPILSSAKASTLVVVTTAVEGGETVRV